MDQEGIARFKLSIWHELMNHGDHAHDPVNAAQVAETIYEQFYLGKQPTLGTTKRSKKR